MQFLPKSERQISNKKEIYMLSLLLRVPKYIDHQKRSMSAHGKKNLHAKFFLVFIPHFQVFTQKNKFLYEVCNMHTMVMLSSSFGFAFAVDCAIRPHVEWQHSSAEQARTPSQQLTWTTINNQLLSINIERRNLCFLKK